MKLGNRSSAYGITPQTNQFRTSARVKPSNSGDPNVPHPIRRDARDDSVLFHYCLSLQSSANTICDLSLLVKHSRWHDRTLCAEMNRLGLPRVLMSSLLCMYR